MPLRISPSITSTFFPLIASAAPRFIDRNVFPEPGLKDVMAITLFLPPVEALMNSMLVRARRNASFMILREPSFTTILPSVSLWWFLALVMERIFATPCCGMLPTNGMVSASRSFLLRILVFMLSCRKMIPIGNSRPTMNAIISMLFVFGDVGMPFPVGGVITLVL